MRPRRLARKWDDSVFDLLARVAAETRVSMRRLQSEEKTRNVHRARIVAWLVLRHEGHSFPRIGTLTGGIHHSTVMHGLSVASEREMKIAGDILGKVITAAAPPPKQACERPSVMAESQRREELFRANVAKWRALCAEDLNLREAA